MGEFAFTCQLRKCTSLPASTLLCMKNAQMPKRFHSLDVVRGIAALSVVLWHWQHFFYDGTIGKNFSSLHNPTILPSPCFTKKEISLSLCFSRFPVSFFIGFMRRQSEIEKSTEENFLCYVFRGSILCIS